MLRKREYAQAGKVDGWQGEAAWGIAYADPSNIVC